MDLLDLIGDSRTDSLPPGFLKSIKMKYKQETSRVFPPGTPYQTNDVAKACQGGQRTHSEGVPGIGSAPVSNVGIIKACFQI